MDARRILPLSGVAFVVLGLLAVVVFGGDTPDSGAPGREIASYYDAHEAREFIATFVLAASVPFLVFFAVSLALALWPGESGRPPVWELVLIAGAVATGATLLVAAMLHFALVDAADSASPGGLEALASLDANVWVAFNAGFGVMMLGAAGSLLAQAAGPRWLGWAALVLGIALFIPWADFFALLLTLVWIIVTSLLLFRERLGPTYAAAPHAA